MAKKITVHYRERKFIFFILVLFLNFNQTNLECLFQVSTLSELRSMSTASSPPITNTCESKISAPFIGAVYGELTILNPFSLTKTITNTTQLSLFRSDLVTYSCRKR